MDAIERLRRDHALLRAKLAVIENVLQLGEEAWLTLRELCFSLLRQLQDHIAREWRLVLECRGRVGAAERSALAAEHEEEPARIRVLNQRLLIPPTDFASVAQAVASVVTHLRRHMDDEEASLFPLLEQALAAPSQASAGAAPLDETMSVNRLVQRFPQTRQILEGLFINVPIEGFYCLDEVAWRHGLAYQELAEALQVAIGAAASSQHEPSAA